jgi:hypothetical protein
MTKYILNSGSARHYPEKAKKFYGEMLSGLSKKPKVLYCFFSQPREDWESKYEGYKKGFAELASAEIDPIFDLAFPDKFEKQAEWADLILIQGGDDHLLQYWLSKFDLEKIWEGKVVATSSCGSNALVGHFWTCDWRKCMDGFGILPVKFIAHYNSNYGADDPRGKIDWEKAFAELKEYGDKKLPIHALKEGD